MLCCFQSHGHPKIDTISAALTSVTRAGNAPPTPADSANTSLTHNFALAPCLHASQGTICTATPSHNNYGETCYLYISKRKNYLFNIDIEGSLVYPIKSSEPGAHVYRLGLILVLILCKEDNWITWRKILEAWERTDNIGYKSIESKVKRLVKTLDFTIHIGSTPTFLYIIWISCFG